MLAKLPTIAAYAYKKSIGQPFVYPRNDLTYCENFLRMMFAVPTEPFEADPDFVDALNLLLIVHADHEQNCSTSTVRMVGSSGRELVCVDFGRHLRLVGPAARRGQRSLRRHAAADRQRRRQREEVRRHGQGQGQPFLLMGFGHRVYKNFDPRATIIKAACDKLLAKRHINDPIFDVAKQLEEVALKDEYFIERKLYPNVDFYSGVIYRAIGIPGADVHGALRHGPATRLDRPLAGNAPEPEHQNLPPAADLRRRAQTRLRADGQAQVGRPL